MQSNLLYRTECFNYKLMLNFSLAYQALIILYKPMQISIPVHFSDTLNVSGKTFALVINLSTFIL